MACLWLAIRKVRSRYEKYSVLVRIFVQSSGFSISLGSNDFHSSILITGDTDVQDGNMSMGRMFEALGETIEFAGMAVAGLAKDSNKLAKTGKILLTCDLAREYGFQDTDGSIHDIRSISNLLNAYGWKTLSAVIPSFVRIPLFFMHMGANRF